MKWPSWFGSWPSGKCRLLMTTTSSKIGASWLWYSIDSCSSSSSPSPSLAPPSFYSTRLSSGTPSTNRKSKTNGTKCTWRWWSILVTSQIHELSWSEKWGRGMEVSLGLGWDVGRGGDAVQCRCIYALLIAHSLKGCCFFFRGCYVSCIAIRWNGFSDVRSILSLK